MSKITVFKINLPTSLFLSILLFQVLIKDACGSFSISWKQMKTKLTSNYEIVLLCFCRRIWLTWILYIIKAHTQENSFYIQKKLWHKILSVRLLVIKLVFCFYAANIYYERVDARMHEASREIPDPRWSSSFLYPIGFGGVDSRS